MPEHLETQFLTTPWTLILGSRDDGATDGPTRALVSLCENYRYPIYAFIRKRCGDAEEARDLCQAFFAFLIEKKIYRSASPDRGKFRTFLLASVKNFLHNQHRHDRAEKRAGGKQHIPIDTTDAEKLYEIELSKGTPEALFDRVWASAVFDRAWAILRAEYQQIGKIERFEILRPTLMAPDDSLPYEELADQLDLSEGGVKTAVFRLRNRFRTIFRCTVAQLVENPGDVDEEINYLMQAIAHSDDQR